MQTLTVIDSSRNGQLLDTRTSKRLRAFRFLSQSFVQRERSGAVAEMVLFAAIFLISTWPLVSLAQAFSVSR